MFCDSARDVYRRFCNSEPSVPLFCQDWWLDIVCGEQAWDVVIVERGGQIQACLPYYRPCPDRICMPPLTQTLGPWIRPGEGRYAKELARRQDLMGHLIDLLPPVRSFRQCFHPSLTDWLPFCWRGFQQTTRYSYRITTLCDLSAVWNETLPGIRTDVRKAEKTISIREGVAVSLWSAIEKTFARQGSQAPFRKSLVLQLADACVARKAGQVLIGEDRGGRVHTAALLVWDQEACYYLLGGADPSLRNSGAGALLLWSGIQMARRRVNCFDFEGSMVKSIERFFRSFGARQIPYFSICRENPSLPDRLWRSSRSKVGKLLRQIGVR